MEPAQTSHTVQAGTRRSRAQIAAITERAFSATAACVRGCVEAAAADIAAESRVRRCDRVMVEMLTWAPSGQSMCSPRPRRPARRRR